MRPAARGTAALAAMGAGPCSLQVPHESCTVHHSSLRRPTLPSPPHAYPFAGADTPGAVRAALVCGRTRVPALPRPGRQVRAAMCSHCWTGLCTLKRAVAGRPRPAVRLQKQRIYCCASCSCRPPCRALPPCAAPAAASARCAPTPPRSRRAWLRGGPMWLPWPAPCLERSCPPCAAWTVRGQGRWLCVTTAELACHQRCSLLRGHCNALASMCLPRESCSASLQQLPLHPRPSLLQSWPALRAAQPQPAATSCLPRPLLAVASTGLASPPARPRLGSSKLVSTTIGRRLLRMDPLHGPLQLLQRQLLRRLPTFILLHPI